MRTLAYVLGGSGAALTAAATVFAVLAGSTEGKIRTGGFSTGGDIATAAQDVRVYQGVEYTGFAIGVPALLTGVAFLVFGPSPSNPATTGSLLQGGAIRW